MELFSKDITPIQEEIEFIKKGLITTKSKRIIDSIEVLETFAAAFDEVGGKVDDDTTKILVKNTNYREQRFEEMRYFYRQNIKNFVKVKDFHNELSGKVIDACNSRDYRFYTNRPVFLKESEMAELICDFLNDEFGQADYFKELIENKRIYRLNLAPDDECPNGVAGYTLYNFLNYNNYLMISNDSKIRDVYLMKIIVHEYGHAIDNLDRRNISRKRDLSYGWLSSYMEVYSLLYEQLFLEYLIKNNIHTERAYGELKNHFIDMFSDFNSLQYLSTLEDKLIINERYKRSPKGFMEQIQFDEEGSMFLVSDAILEGFRGISEYSYGALIANYFVRVKEDNLEDFNRLFEVFKARRYDLFNPSIFEEIGTTPDETVKLLDKELDKVSDKKLILK